MLNKCIFCSECNLHEFKVERHAHFRPMDTKRYLCLASVLLRDLFLVILQPIEILAAGLRQKNDIPIQ